MCRSKRTLIAEIGKQVRTISHLLHPPLLDEAGLESALRCYVEGFAARSKIDARLEMPTNLERLPSDIELTLFRVVQECLTNIHRHSGSPTAIIRLLVEGASIRVEIRDAGKGMASEKAFESSSQAGVGLRGMRERLRLIGGTLNIGSDGQGTRVIAIAPVPVSTIPTAPFSQVSKTRLAHSPRHRTDS